MGYGSRALKALNAYYSGEIVSVDEETRAEPEYPFPGKVGKVRGVFHKEEFLSKSTDLLTDEPSVRAPSEMPPLLIRLSERKPETLDYIGVSYGLTPQLLRQVNSLSTITFANEESSLCRFWKRAGYIPLYMRQTTNELTGEHSCVMVRGLNSSTESELEWLAEFAKGVQNTLATHIDRANGVRLRFPSPFSNFTLLQL